MKRREEIISVKLRGGMPFLIHRKLGHRKFGRTEVKAIMDFWIYQGKWWTKEEEKRTYFRVLADTGVMEIMYDGKQWKLLAIAD